MYMYMYLAQKEGSQVHGTLVLVDQLMSTLFSNVLLWLSFFFKVLSHYNNRLNLFVLFNMVAVQKSFQSCRGLKIKSNTLFV